MSGRVTDLAHELLASRVRVGSKVLDATVGNGHDTLWMAQQVGPTGHVWGLDKQRVAICRTRERLAAHEMLGHVTLCQIEHGSLDHAPGLPQPQRLDAAIVNLGYLPGGDKSICTDIDQTKKLIDWLLSRLAGGGRMVCCVYPGHEAGAVESSWIRAQAQRLPSSYGHSWIHRAANKGEACPWIWHLQRRDPQP